jgi:signal transduction histidine kinase
MGLSIAFMVMNDHGGSIAVDSKLGRGTTVTLKLPVTS